jgi:hypothetical protein
MIRSWHDVALWGALVAGLAVGIFNCATERFYVPQDAIFTCVAFSVAISAAAALVAVHRPR